MQTAIKALTHLGGKRFRENTQQAGFIGYSARVTDPEQFIPLFSCLPDISQDTPVRTITSNRSTIPWVLFPRTQVFVDSLVPVIRNSIFYYLVSVMSGSTLTISERTIFRFLASTRYEDMMSFRQSDKDYLRSVWPSLVTRLRTTQTILKVQVLAHCKATLVASIPSSHRINTKAKDVGYIYGLYEPTAISYRVRGVVRDWKAVITNSEQSPWLIFNQLVDAEGNDKNLGVASHYGYAGITVKQQPANYRFFNFMQKFSTNSNAIHHNPPLYNLFGGVRSMFCIMVKAKLKPYITTMAFLGLQNELQLEKGDLELWEDEELMQTLGTSARTYVKVIQSKVRNKMKSPVRVFSDLTRRLFTIEEPVLESIAQIKEEASSVIKRANDAARVMNPNDDSWRNYGIKMSPKNTGISL